MDQKYDVVIVGAGIAGSITGKALAQQGHSVLLLEEHHEVGRPVQCAGLVTPRIFQQLQIPEDNCILNEVRGARIYSPSGQEMFIDAGKTKAVVIDRVKFDQGCVARALHAGCEIALGTKALSARYNKDLVEVRIQSSGEQHLVRCKLLVGADGVQSQVAHWFGLSAPKTILSGFGAELTGVRLDPEFVEIYLGNNVAPNFFAWVIPTARNVDNGLIPARVGLACTKAHKPARSYFEELFHHAILGPKLADAKPVQYIAGGIPIGQVPKSYADNLMLVGDAAGQVKPTSGGGVYTSIVCANLCAQTALSTLASGKLSAKNLKAYQKMWQAEMGKELKHGYRLFKVFMHLRDDQLEEGFKLLGKEHILKMISTEGDIDYPSKVTTKVIKKIPQLLKFAKPYLRSFF